LIDMCTRAAIIDGEAMAAEIRLEVCGQVERLRERGVHPGLAVVLAGEDPASLSYIRSKARACDEAGIVCETIGCPADIPQEQILELIRELSCDPRFHGILVQQPLPEQIDRRAIVSSVAPEKDVDGLHPVNMGLLLEGRPHFVPCTALAVQQLLLRSGHDPAGKRVAIVGRSNLVGKSLAALLMQPGRGGDATVTVCHRCTPDLAEVTSQADIVVAAAGQPGLVTAEMVREGATVIDVGINRISDPGRRRGYRLVGDVDFEPVSWKAGAVTPVPGGVGPMTVAMLLVNTLKAASRPATCGPG
jgi:methylenetetrahydrofolate dehydrogenase (NADP+)/methenyltetrahydrofolate cyclohydrolase